MKKFNKETLAFVNNAVICPDNHQDNKDMVATVNSELMQYGYVLTEDAFKAMSKSDPAFIKSWAKKIFRYLEQFLPTGTKFIPIHSGFPRTVRKMSQADVYLTQMIAYWTGGEIKEIETKDKTYAYEHISYKQIVVWNEEHCDRLFTKLISLPSGISERENRVIDWYLENYEKDKLNSLIPNSVPFKETLTKLASHKLDVPVKTSIDVLRIASILSGNTSDISLPPRKVKKNKWSAPILNPEYVNKKWKLKSSEGKYIMNLLDKVCKSNKYILSEMILKRTRWVTLAKHIYAGSYKDKYPDAFAAIQVMRQKKDYPKSWYGYVAAAFNKSFEKGVDKLSERPGEFARRIDSLIRTTHIPAYTGKKVRKALEESREKQISYTLTKFQEVAPKISNKVLFELWTHFESRTDDQTYRQVWTGEKRIPTKLTPLKGLGENLVNEVIETIWNVLYEKFKQLDSLGTVYIDPKLKDIPLPTNMKSLTDSLDIVVRGQRTPLEVNKTLRCFMHIPNKRRTGVTIDLSAIFVNKLTSTQCTWSHRKLFINNAVLHSGDVYPKTGNVAEYIDMDLNKLKESGYEYALVQLNNYTKTKELYNACTAGFCEVEHPENNSIWIPKTTKFSFKPTVKAKTNLMLVDIQKKEYIILDQDLKGAAINNISVKDIREMIKVYAGEIKYSVWDLLKLHADARGTYVEEITPDTKTIFKFKDFAKDYTETLKYMI